MLRPHIPCLFLFPAIPHPRIVFVRVSVGVCSAWAVGGVVVMESVLCDLWAGLQDANQEVWGWRRAPGLRTARGADQTLQHSSVSWLVASPYTWYTCSLCPLHPAWLSSSHCSFQTANLTFMTPALATRLFFSFVWFLFKITHLYAKYFTFFRAYVCASTAQAICTSALLLHVVY